MAPDTQRRLEDHFAPHNKRLAALLNWPPQWPH
jgi:hypothetical protein